MASTSGEEALPQRTNRRGQKLQLADDLPAKQEEQQEEPAPELETRHKAEDATGEADREVSTSGREQRGEERRPITYTPIEHVEYRTARVGSYNFECERLEAVASL